jgi:hypothetical protein
MNFRQWLIEASFTLRPLLSAYCAYCLGSTESCVYLYESFYIVAIWLQIPLFVLMRYAETQEDYFLNALQTSFFHIFCKLP